MIETKEKILLGMLDLVAETGLEKASIGRLCKKIKVSPGNVYFYFSSKVELLNTLYYYCVSSLIEAIDVKNYTDISKDEECSVYTALMEDLVKKIIYFYKSNPNMLNFMITSKSSCYLSEEIKKGRFAGANFFNSFWEKCKDKGIIKNVSTEFIIAFILGVIYEFMKEDIIHQNISLDDDKIDILNDLIWSGLYTENKVLS